ncbi:hypothetical protein D3C73_928130 [compost metagenome]
MKEGNIAWLYFGFNQQLVIKWDDLHQIATGLNHPTDGIHHDLLDDTADRRGDHSTIHAVFQCFDAGLRLTQIGTGFV